MTAFVDQAIDELGATLNAALVVIGDRLGLYTALSGAGPLTPRELAERTDTRERYVREWLNAQAAGGYVIHSDGRYALPDEHAAALDDLAGAFEQVVALVRDEPTAHDLFGARSHAVRSFLPALDGLEATLEAGVRVADVGCGDGAATMAMADAFPYSDFRGFDPNPAAIEQARANAAYRARFDVAGAQDFPGGGYALVTTFDCLHDEPDPVAAARHIHQALAPDGRWLIVEPVAGDGVDDNLTPVGRVYYALSTLVCMRAPTAHALGAQAGEARLRDVVVAAGFTRFARVAVTPFNLVLEARP
jgi:SAM-dependent methyltransferase